MYRVCRIYPGTKFSTVPKDPKFSKFRYYNKYSTAVGPDTKFSARPAVFTRKGQKPHSALVRLDAESTPCTYQYLDTAVLFFLKKNEPVQFASYRL